MFPPQWLLTRYLHFVVAVTSEELVTADSQETGKHVKHKTNKCWGVDAWGRGEVHPPVT